MEQAVRSTGENAAPWFTLCNDLATHRQDVEL